MAGLQLYGSQQLYSSEVLTISPEIGVLAGVGVENYDEPIFTGASIALSFAFGTARSVFLVFDPSVSVSGQESSLGFGARISAIVAFQGGN